MWSRVSGEDRAMLISLMGSIPFMLKKMEESGVKISRSWEDWNLLASGMVEILRRIITEAEKLAREAREAEALRKAEALAAKEDNSAPNTISGKLNTQEEEPSTDNFKRFDKKNKKR